MSSFLFPVGNPRTISRRSFLARSGSLAAAAIWSSRAIGAVLANPTFSDHPFQLGIASGDPTPTGVVLWTRLAPKPLEGGGMTEQPVEISWQVAHDDKMTKVVQKGTTVATPEWGHSVHVEVDGLAPDRWYFYQFKAGSEVSPVGRTRTFPAMDAKAQRLRFAFASCQHYETGYYTAYAHMAREDLDLVAHLGDYIYEGGPDAKAVRRHNSPEIQSLDDYRNRYALYKSDDDLRAAHAAFPWLVTWDDHEVDNNYANDISEEKNVDSATFLKRRANAYQAYYEHMPLRRASLPTGPNMLLYRKVSFGPLADFFVLDTRQYRTDQPCGDGAKVPCKEVFDPKGTILGDQQKKWLEDSLAGAQSRWNILAQQVMMARVGKPEGSQFAYAMDQWPGFEADRRRLLTFLDERTVANPVVLTGDIHSNWANELQVDFDDKKPRTVAVEFVGTSISSSGDGAREPKYLKRMMSDHPFVKFHNEERGYVQCEVSPDQWKSDYKVVEYVSRKGAPLITRASFVVENGRPELNSA